MSKESYIEEIRPHDSAYKHVSGYAEYRMILKNQKIQFMVLLVWVKKHMQ